MNDRIDEELRRAVNVLLADTPDVPTLPSTKGPDRKARSGPVSLTLASVAVLLVIGIPTALVLSGRQAVRDPGASPDLGTWRQGSTAPFGPRHEMFSAALGDGRVIVWGGIERNGDGGYKQQYDGGIYDPTTDTWETIQSAPLHDLSVIGIKLAAGRLAILGDGGMGQIAGGAILDADSGRWSEVPGHPDPRVIVDGFDWDGQTLAVVSVGGAERTLDRPVTSRWEYETFEWSPGAPFPFEPRAGFGLAVDSSRIAVWGGISSDGQVHSDGAVYLVDDDRWDPIPTAPISGRVDPQAAWIESGFVVGGGLESLNPDVSDLDPNGPPYDPGFSPGLAVYDPESGEWQSLPSPPKGSGFNGPFNPLIWSRFYHDSRSQLLVHATWGGGHPKSGIHAAYWYVEATGAWEWTPMADLHPADGYLVATSRTDSNPDNVPFSVQVWNDQWSAKTAAPFTNRMASAVVVVDDHIVIVGGAEGRELDQRNDTWVIDIER